jgi:integrase
LRRHHDPDRHRHGLRAAELCDLRWSQVELNADRLHPASSRTSGEWSNDDYDVLEKGFIAGPIFKELIAPTGPPLDLGEPPALS